MLVYGKECRRSPFWCILRILNFKCSVLLYVNLACNGNQQNQQKYSRRPHHKKKQKREEKAKPRTSRKQHPSRIVHSRPSGLMPGDEKPKQDERKQESEKHKARRRRKETGEHAIEHAGRRKRRRGRRTSNEPESPHPDQ